ncbi:hypothetical protein QBC35DRAFT_487856 [Podospora australis]|uniref:Translocation protein sec72 n=1 Tax=Podospora australis TaxID=1536484 RepID=A0AAN7AM84_9PEZI|nr:hypothetical protein QBC35DRAFT_487856 [Podospora australis]
MSDQDTFTFIPLVMDPKSKAISSATSPTSKALEAELLALNNLHRSLHGLDAPHVVPPPPVPVNPKRSAQVTKLRESGNTEYRKGNHAEAIKFYTLGLQMALTRPPWEPSQLVREEVHQLYSNRAQAHMQKQNWVEGAIDAEASVACKSQGNAKAWFRRGKCLLEMGRVQDARNAVAKALEFEGEEGGLAELKKEIDAKLAKDKVVEA